MKLRKFALGSVVGLSLIGLSVAPSLAQDDPSNPPQMSTPVERQQTQQLNQQATDGTVAPQAQGQYDTQQQQYQDQQQRYREQRAQYIQDLHRYDVAQYAWTDYPARAYAYRFNDPAFVRVDTLDRRDLADAPIEGPDGRWVGRIRSVAYAPDGGSRIEIALNRRVSVLVNPVDLAYDPDNRVFYTDLTRAQLWAMPGETIETTDYYRP